MTTFGGRLRTVRHVSRVPLHLIKVVVGRYDLMGSSLGSEGLQVKRTVNLE